MGALERSLDLVILHNFWSYGREAASRIVMPASFSVQIPFTCGQVRATTRLLGKADRQTHLNATSIVAHARQGASQDRRVQLATRAHPSEFPSPERARGKRSCCHASIECILLSKRRRAA